MEIFYWLVDVVVLVVVITLSFDVNFVYLDGKLTPMKKSNQQLQPQPKKMIYFRLENIFIYHHLMLVKFLTVKLGHFF